MDDFQVPKQSDFPTLLSQKGKRKPSRLNVDGKPRIFAGAGHKLIQSAQRILREQRPVIQIDDSTFMVPAETPGVGYYNVILDPLGGDWCQCPDYRNRHEVSAKGARCKHIVAADLWNKHQLSGAALTEIVVPSRKVAHNNPPGYNETKARTIRCTEQCVRCLIGKIQLPEANCRGRKQKSMASVLAQVLLLAAGRGAGSRIAIRDERELYKLGIITTSMSFATRLRYMAKPEVKKLMHELLAKTTEHLPVKEASIDATFFKTPYSREYKEKVVYHDDGSTSTVKIKIPNAKLHIVVDNDTQLILAARVTHGYESDSHQFADLFDEVRVRFGLLEAIYADAGYYTHEFYPLVGQYGITPNIDMPTTANKNGELHHDRQLQLRIEREKAGLDRVNPRSNVESVNSAIKGMTYRVLRTQRAHTREVELVSMCIIYNLMRMVLLNGTRPDFPIPFADEQAEESIARAAF